MILLFCYFLSFFSAVFIFIQVCTPWAWGNRNTGVGVFQGNVTRCFMDKRGYQNQFIWDNTGTTSWDGVLDILTYLIAGHCITECEKSETYKKNLLYFYMFIAYIIKRFRQPRAHHAISRITLTDSARGEQYRMKGQSEIAYLPKFANMMLIVMVIVITEILYIILIFDCFAENQ